MQGFFYLALLSQIWLFLLYIVQILCSVFLLVLVWKNKFTKLNFECRNHRSCLFAFFKLIISFSQFL